MGRGPYKAQSELLAVTFTTQLQHKARPRSHNHPYYDNYYSLYLSLFSALFTHKTTQTRLFNQRQYVLRLRWGGTVDTCLYYKATITIHSGGTNVACRPSLLKAEGCVASDDGDGNVCYKTVNGGDTDAQPPTTQYNIASTKLNGYKRNKSSFPAPCQLQQCVLHIVQHSCLTMFVTSTVIDDRTSSGITTNIHQST